MFKFLWIVSIIASVVAGVFTIIDISNLRILIECISWAILSWCLYSFQDDTKYALSTQQNLIFSLQQRCNNLEKEVKELKRKK